MKADATGEAYDIGYITAGGTIVYDLNVAMAGPYDLVMTYSSPSGGTAATILINGVSVGSLSLNSTGSWSTYDKATALAMTLPAGIVTLEVQAQQSGFNIGGLSLAAVTATPTPAPANFISYGTGGLNLTAGSSVTIGNGISLKFTSTADLQIVNSADQILWHTGTAATCTSCSLNFQGDGNLVIYANGKAIWSSASYNDYGTLVLQPTASYLTIRNSNYEVVWTSDGTASPGETTSALSATKATAVSSFIDSLAVNSHMDQYEGAVSVVLSKLQYLGLHHIRDHYADNGSLLANYTTLADAGIHFDMLDYSNTFSSLISHAETLQALGTLSSVEGLNEINNFSFSCNGSTWAGGWPNDNGPAAECFMTTYYTDLKADSKLKNIPMFDLTGGNSANSAAAYGLMGLANQADYGNIHVYPGSGEQPAGPLLQGLGSTYYSVLPTQAVITETGYSTAHQSGPVSATVQSILVMNTFLDAYKDGFLRTFIYELTDNSSEGYGLFDTSNNPKAAATTLHNLTTILSDTGTPSTLKTLNYSISGLANTGATLLLQKSNGAFGLILWNEASVWNGSSDVTVPSANAVINLGATFSKVTVYNPSVGTSAIQTVTKASSITVPYAAQALVIEITP